MKYILIICMTVPTAFGGFFLKRASGTTKNFWKLLHNKDLWIGGILYVSATVFMIWLLQMVDYSVAVPLGSLTYVWSQLVAKYMLHETITKRRVAGLCMILAGVVMLAAA